MVGIYRDIEFPVSLFDFKDINEGTVSSFFIINVVYPVVRVRRSFQGSREKVGGAVLTCYLRE